MGDKGFYWSSTYLDKSSNYNQNRIYHCYVDFSEFTSLYVEESHPDTSKIDIPFLLENVIYSPQGKWGILLSDEGHGLMGGTSKFMKVIEELVPDINSQVHDFIIYFNYLYKNDSNTISWIPKLLAHVYGQETADKLLREAKLI